MRKRMLALLSAVGLLLAMCACAGVNRELRIGTGTAGGNYALLGEAIKDILQESLPDSTFTVRQTAGSAANLNLMQKNFLDLGIVQSNLLYNAQYGRNDYADSGKVQGIGAVAALYPEALQIAVPADSGLRDVMDLAGHRVSVCEEQSGTEYDVKNLLRALAIPEAAVELVNMDYAQSAKALEDGSIDAFAVTARVPFEALTVLSARMPIRLLQIPEKMRQLIWANLDQYDPLPIPADTYAGQTDEVLSVSVVALLAATDRVSSETIQKILSVLDEAGLVMDLPGWDVFIRFHPGAAAYFGDDRLPTAQESTNGKQSFVFGSQDG